MKNNFEYMTAINYEHNKEKKKNNFFPNIPKFSKIYDIKMKTSYNFKEDIHNPLKKYINEKKDVIKSKKKDFKNLTSDFNKTIANNFIENRKKKIENEMNNLDNIKDRKALKVLNHMEKQKSFKNILKYKENLIIELKSKYNQWKYELKVINNKLEYQNKNNDEDELDKYNIKIEALCRQDEILNKNILQEVFKEPLYENKKQELKKDLFTLNKKTEILKLKLKEAKNLDIELNKEMNKVIENTNIILNKMFKMKKNINSDNKELDRMYNEIFKNGLSQFEDEIKLDKIIKFEHENEIANNKKRLKEEETKRKKIIDKNIEKNKNLLEEYHNLKHTLENKMEEFNNFLIKIKISKYVDIIPYFNSLKNSKLSLNDIIKNYKKEIEESNIEINNHKNKLTNLIIDSTNKKSKNTDKFEEERLRLLELEYNSKVLKLSQIEINYQKLNKIFFDCASTVSRIIYQLNNDNSDNIKNFEVKRDNIVELLSFIGLRLERMIALIYTKSKIEIGKNIFVNEETIMDGVTKPPKYLNLNSNINDSFEKEDEKNDKVIRFEN